MEKNNNEFVEKCKYLFLKELDENPYWRVYRLSTFKDLIFSKIAKYNNTYLPSDKIELINLCIKGLIIQKIGQLDNFDLSPSQIIETVRKEKPALLKEYESIIENKQENDRDYTFLLNDEKSYLKIVSQIDPEFFPEKNIHQILINLLNK